MSFSALLGLCVVLGCLNGVFYSMVLAVIVEFMGLDNFAVSFGFIELFKNITVAAAYPMAGWLEPVLTPRNSSDWHSLFTVFSHYC